MWLRPLSTLISFNISGLNSASSSTSVLEAGDPRRASSSYGGFPACFMRSCSRAGSNVRPSLHSCKHLKEHFSFLQSNQWDEALKKNNSEKKPSSAGLHGFLNLIFILFLLLLPVLTLHQQWLVVMYSVWPRLLEVLSPRNGRARDFDVTDPWQWWLPRPAFARLCGNGQ